MEKNEKQFLVVSEGGVGEEGFWLGTHPPRLPVPVVGQSPGLSSEAGRSSSERPQDSAGVLHHPRDFPFSSASLSEEYIKKIEKLFNNGVLS